MAVLGLGPVTTSVTQILTSSVLLGTCPPGVAGPGPSELLA